MIALDFNICLTLSMGCMDNSNLQNRTTEPTSELNETGTKSYSTNRRIAVISSSPRDGRVNRVIAEWVVEAVTASGDTADLIDVAEIVLPDDADLYPGGGPESEVASRIDAAEAFVVVTPEYNHAYPASLKRLIDWHYTEWMLKPATVISYGVQGGYAAAEQLRGVLPELNMVTIRRFLGLAAPWDALDSNGHFAPDESTDRALTAVLDELSWWTDVLTDARMNRPFPGAGSAQRPFTLINTFTAVDGGIDTLAAFQIAEMQDMSAEALAYGWLGNEVYRSDDDTSLIVLTRFRSAEAKEGWSQTDRFQQHVEDLGPLVQNVTSTPVTFVAAHGDGHPNPQNP